MTVRQDQKGKAESAEAVTAIRTALRAGDYDPIALFNWDAPHLPERDRGKVPLGKGWQKANGVPRFDARATNTGVLTGTVYPADIDVDDSEAATRLKAIAQRIFGPVPTHRSRSNSPRVLLPYRVETPYRKRVILLSCGKIEFLGKGQQFAAYGRHYTGVELTWRSGGLTKIPLHKLPVISKEQIDDFEREVTKLYPPAQRATNGDAHRHQSKADFRNTKLGTDAEAALLMLDPNDYSRAQCTRFGFAYRRGGGSFEVWHAWVKRSDFYDKGDGEGRTTPGPQWAQTEWRSYGNEPAPGDPKIDVATLFQRVFTKFPGWKKPSERRADYQGPEDAEEDFGGGVKPDDPFSGTEALPLCQEPRSLEPYPLEALGPLQTITESIAESVGCEPSLAAQSVLMAACLAVVGIADIDLPRIGVTPLALYLITVALSSERKSSADRRALRGVKARVAQLAEERAAHATSHTNAVKAYTAEAGFILRDRKLDRATRKAKLDALGPEPKPLLKAVLAAHDVTVEGVMKAWGKGELWPIQALTTSEGGMFVAGAAMSHEMRMRTVATMCALWDGEAITKLRAGDGVMSIGSKRITAHLMIQPNFIPELLGDALLRAQGFLSRLLVSWPRSRIGYRAGSAGSAAAAATEKVFCDRIHELLFRHLKEELELSTLRVEGKAAELWDAYSDEIEIAQQPGAEYAELTDVAGKSAEMAGRIAGVMTLFEKPGASSVSPEIMRKAIALARWYLNEALRIAESGVLRPEIVDAKELLEWLKEHPEQRSRRRVLRFGPRRLRSKRALDLVLRILVEHNLIVLPKKGSIHVRD